MAYADVEWLVLLPVGCAWMLYMTLLYWKSEHPNSYRRFTECGGAPTTAKSIASASDSGRGGILYYYRRLAIAICITLVLRGVDTTGRRGVYPVAFATFLARTTQGLFLAAGCAWIGYTAHVLYRQLNQNSIPNWLFGSLWFVSIGYFVEAYVTLAVREFGDIKIAQPIGVGFTLASVGLWLIACDIITIRLRLEMHRYVATASSVASTTQIEAAMYRLTWQVVVINLVLGTALVVGALGVARDINALRDDLPLPSEPHAGDGGGSADAVLSAVGFVLPFLFVNAHPCLCSCRRGASAGTDAIATGGDTVIVLTPAAGDTAIAGSKPSASPRATAPARGGTVAITVSAAPARNPSIPAVTTTGANF